MKAPKVITVFVFLLFESKIQVISKSLIDNFIAKSDKTITIVTINNADNTFSFPDRKSLIFFNIKSEKQEACGYSMEIGTKAAVRDSKCCSDFRNTELDSDFIIFSPANHLRWAIDCVVNAYETFLFYVSDDEINFSEPDLIDILNQTWIKKGTLKVFLAINDSVYFFDPFLNINGSFGKLNSGSDLSYARTLPANLNGYTINVEMFDSTYTIPKNKNPTFVEDFNGPDAEAAKYIRERLNATMAIIANDGTKFGFKAENGSLTGALKTIQSRESDIAFIGCFIKDYGTRDVEFSAPVYSDELCVIDKPAGRIPQFILPLIVFDQTLWMFLCLDTLLGVFFWILLRLLNNRLNFNQDDKDARSHAELRPLGSQYLQIFVDFYILFLSAPLRRFPRAQSERVFIGTICLLSLNIVSLFQSSLATVFIKPVYYKNIETLKQFSETNKKILVKYPAMLSDLFPEDSSDTFRTLHDRMVLLAKPELTATNIFSMGMASVTRKTNSKLSKEQNSVYLIPDCPRNYNLAFLLSKHSVFQETVNAIILDISQFGHIDKWIDDINFQVRLQISKFILTHSSQAKVLELADMQLPFYLLIIGVSLASFVLFLEKIMTSYSKRSDNKYQIHD